MTYVPTAQAAYSIQTATAAVTLTDYTKIVLADATAAAFSVTLAPAAGNIGEEVEVLKTDSSPNAVTILAPAGATINGNPSLALAKQREGVSLRVISATELVASDDVSVDIRPGVKTVTAAVTLTADDEVVYVDATAGAVVVTLPAAATVGSASKAKNFYIKKIDGSTNAVTVARSGTDLIEDPSAPGTPAASISFNAQGTSFNLATATTLDAYRII